MTSTSRRRPAAQRDADPWWGIDEPAASPAPAFDGKPARGRSSGGRGARRARKVRRTGLARVGWLLVGVLVAPLDLLGRLLARSPRLRRAAIRVLVVAVIAAILACSVGVILINNVVIGRTAELGELDDARRELRRENALLGAQAARLSSPDVVFRRATRELGMVRTDDVPQFMYLVPGSRTLTPLQRQRVAAQARKREAAAAARAARAATPAAATAPKPRDPKQGETE